MSYGCQYQFADHPPVSLRAACQFHHILPLGLNRFSQIAHFITALAPAGFSLHDRSRNCMWLPAEEWLAIRSGRALHRGPHPRYTNLVADRIDRIRAGKADMVETLRRLHRLQGALSRALGKPGQCAILLHRRDPMRTFGDYQQLDDAIEKAMALSAFSVDE